MSSTVTAPLPQETPGRLDVPVLVSNLLAGVCFLGVLAVMSWPLAVVGAIYVVAASVFLAWAYGRAALTRRQEAAVWAAPWLVAAALWAAILGGLEGGTSSWLFAGWAGLVVSTPCYLAWQALALAVRQLTAWRARPAAGAGLVSYGVADHPKSHR